jgi:hypothetical protein
LYLKSLIDGYFNTLLNFNTPGTIVIVTAASFTLSIFITAAAKTCTCD